MRPLAALCLPLRVTAFLCRTYPMANSLLFLRSKDTVRVGDRRDTVREAFLRLGFTPLYADIMTCVFDGNRTTEICAHLNVARGTVKEAKSKSYVCLEFTRSVNLEIGF